MSPVPFWTSARLGLAVLGFFGFILVYSVRVNLSVAIVCMVNKTAISSTHDSSPINSNLSTILSAANESSSAMVENECGHAIPTVVNASAPKGQELVGLL
jgi:hypothetical protein